MLLIVWSIVNLLFFRVLKNKINHGYKLDEGTACFGYLRTT